MPGCKNGQQTEEVSQKGKKRGVPFFESEQDFPSHTGLPAEADELGGEPRRLRPTRRPAQRAWLRWGQARDRLEVTTDEAW